MKIRSHEYKVSRNICDIVSGNIKILKDDQWITCVNREMMDSWCETRKGETNRDPHMSIRTGWEKDCNRHYLSTIEGMRKMTRGGCK